MEAFGASKENESKRRHLDRVCTILRNSENSVVNVWPGYQEQQPQKPVFVMMTKDTCRGQREDSFGIDIYRRRYDLVSDEAAAVLSSEKVQSNRLSGTEMDHMCEMIDEEGGKLFDKHSNITVINGCSYKSKEGGSMLESTPCVVIHCLVKGIIPFGEDLFPGSIGDIPTDVREGLFYLGVCADRGENMDGVEVGKSAFSFSTILFKMHRLFIGSRGCRSGTRLAFQPKGPGSIPGTGSNIKVIFSLFISIVFIIFRRMWT